MDGWSGVDTPQTVMTTRAPAVLKTKQQKRKEKFKSSSEANQGKGCAPYVIKLGGKVLPGSLFSIAALC